jgi:hypothetical protein
MGDGAGKIARQQIDHGLPLERLAALGDQVDLMAPLRQQAQRRLEVAEEPEMGGGEKDLHSSCMRRMYRLPPRHLQDRRIVGLHRTIRPPPPVSTVRAQGEVRPSAYKMAIRVIEV